MIISEGINHGKLRSIIVGELKKAGLKHRLKKIILKSVKDNKTLFGAPLVKAPSCSVICCGSTLCVPIVVSEMSVLLRENSHIEGLFRKAGSQVRQKDIKRLLDAGGCVSEGHHPIDVASVLKLYLRSLPEPLISAEVQDLLIRCRLSSGPNTLTSILHTLLLLPVLHVHLLHYIMELLNFIASHSKDNLMDSSNLAIVMAPSIMPLPAAASAQRLEHHVELVKIFIENSKHIGILTDDLMSQLDEDSEVHVAQRKKRRSGSLNRVLSGLRKMVSGNVNTPATVIENGKTPILTKSAAKRKFDGYEGFSSKKKKEIKQCLPAKELSFTPLKMGLTERKRLRLSMLENRSTPGISSDVSSLKNSETSISSEDLLTSSEHLFSAHDTIDLSAENKQNDYVRISKQEYEEIKNRVSAIETRLSREFTDIIPQVEPLQQVQNVYEQTLEDVARLDCPTSDHLARRLSKELKIRPNEQAKIIRSPSARKIGTIRRRSKENCGKLVRHKSWNVSTHSSHNVDRFYPYIGLRRERTSTASTDMAVSNIKTNLVNDWDTSTSDNCMNNSDTNQKYNLRKRSSVAGDHNLNKTIGRPQKRRSLNSSTSFDVTTDTSANNTLNSSGKSNGSMGYSRIAINKRNSPNKQHKWRSAAAFFMDKTGEIDSSGQSGRPSVNRLRSQNAGAVLAKARLFETNSDKSNEPSNDKILHTGFARRPRLSGQYATKYHKPVLPSRMKEDVYMSRLGRNGVAPALPPRLQRQPLVSQDKDLDMWRNTRKGTPPVKRAQMSPTLVRTPQNLIKKPLCTPRTLRTPISNTEARKQNTPMKGVHISPRRRSPRHKMQR